MPNDSTKELALKPVYEKAIEIYAGTPDANHKDVALMLGIAESTLFRIRRDPNFWAAVYNHYMVTFEGDVVDVLRAMVREAKAGNTSAGRLVLEHSGKLQKNINITIDSPFEKWLKKVEGGIKIKDAEIVEELKEIDDDFSDLPERQKEKGTWKERKDNQKLQKELNKEERRFKRNQNRKVMRSWLKRANAVGVDPLPAKRPTKGQRKAWEDSIIQKENQALEHSQEQVGNSKTPCKPKNLKQGNLKPPTPPKI